MNMNYAINLYLFVEVLLTLFSSARATNEENYIAQKFTRAVIGTNNVDHCARL